MDILPSCVGLISLHLSQVCGLVEQELCQAWRLLPSTVFLRFLFSFSSWGRCSCPFPSSGAKPKYAFQPYHRSQVLL